MERYIFICLLFGFTQSCSVPIYPPGYDPPKPTLSNRAYGADIVLHGKVLHKIDQSSEEYNWDSLYDVEIEVYCTYKFDSYRDIDKDPFKMPKKITVKNAGRFLLYIFIPVTRGLTKDLV